MMNEEFNPYNTPAENTVPTVENTPQPPFNQQVANPQAPAQPQSYNYQQPARPAQQPVQQPAQPIAQPPVQQPAAPRYPQQQQPVYPYRQPVVPQKSSGAAAKAFGMVSFIIGCFTLLITSMIFFNFRSSVTEKFNASLAYSIIFAVPALVFGVVALMKKTEKKLFPILGIAFAVVLMLCAFITYFVMVNTAPAYSYWY